MSNEEILELAKQCGAMKHYFRDELLTFARLIESKTREECARKIDIYSSTTHWAEPLAAAIRSQK
jgi:hypothetical protein